MPHNGLLHNLITMLLTHWSQKTALGKLIKILSDEKNHM